MTEMTRFPRHCYSVTGASSTRPLINGQNHLFDSVHAWRRRGIILNICCEQPVLSRATDHKTGSFQSHPQSTKENALHFMCLACGSLQGSVGTQEYS